LFFYAIIQEIKINNLGHSSGYLNRSSRLIKNMTTIKHNNITWIDIQSPKKKDIKFLKEKFNLHPLILEEFITPSQRPRAEEFDNFLYIVMHIPLYDTKKNVTYSGELDIVITENYLITAHPQTNIPLKAVIKLFNENNEIKQKAMSGTIGFLFYFILEKLISSCFPKLDHINEKIDEIEEGIFDNQEKEMVRELSASKRDILAFRRILKPQRSILESLVKKKYRLLENELNDYFQDLIGTNIRAWNTLENTQEIIESLEDTNSSLLSYKINATMRFLAAISLVTFALSVTTGIFSMHPFKAFSIAQEPITFWIILGFMLFIALCLFTFFKKKKWL